MIYYAKPMHLQGAFAYLGYKQGDFPIAEKASNSVLALPMHPYLTDEQIEYVCENLKLAIKGKS
jgi:UDP-2-acetamido-2-deoxy-ribo-hexuluronate aminotransferase